MDEMRNVGMILRHRTETLYTLFYVNSEIYLDSEC